MSEINKLYQNAGFIKKRCKDYNCIVCEKNKNCDNYPPFTAEKQIELIKWLGRNKNGFGFFNDGTKFLSCHCDFQCEWFDNYFYAEDFGNALAGLVNTFWQDLTEEEKEQIREILK